MEITEIFFLIGNVIMFVGTILLIRTVLKNKKILFGYDLLGAILTFIALLFLISGFMSSMQYASVGFSLITVAYWGFIVAFKFYYKRKDKVTVKEIGEIKMKKIMGYHQGRIITTRNFAKFKNSPYFIPWYNVSRQKLEKDHKLLNGDKV